jgi:hypothetical protein
VEAQVKRRCAGQGGRRGEEEDGERERVERERETSGRDWDWGGAAFLDVGEGTDADEGRDLWCGISSL